MLRKGNDGKKRMACSRSCRMNDMTRVKAERSVDAEQTPAKPPRGRAGGCSAWGSSLACRGLGFGGWRYYAQARETMAVAAQRQRFRADRARGHGEGRRAPPCWSRCRHDPGIHDGQHLCPRQRLHRQAPCRHRRSREGGSASGRDHRARARSSDRAGARRRSSQTEATLRQKQAKCDLASVTWNRDKPLVQQGWTTPQQGSIDRQNLKALEAAVGVAQQNIAAQEAQLRVLQQAEGLSERASRRSTASSPSAISTSAAWCRPTPPAAPSCSRSCRPT